mgnify:CR=1 FL=1
MASRFSQGLKGLGKDDAPAPKRKAAPAVAAKKSRAGQGDVVKEAAPVRYQAPSRQGKKAVTGYYDPAVRQQLAILAAEEQRSQNDLIAEALNLLFRNHGKSPIAKG